MRNFFLILLLANMAYFTWNHWFAGSGDGSVAGARADSVPSLELISEAEAQLFGATDDSNGDTDLTATARDVPSPRCVSMGPFVELTRAAEAMAALTSSGYSPNQRLAEGQIWSGYWVHIPPLSSREEAREVLTALQRKNVSEQPYVVSRGESRNAISLGVYSEYQRAQRRVSQIEHLGHTPQITVRHRMGQVYWIDFDLEPGQEINPVAFTTNPEQIVRLEDRSCGTA